MERNYTVVGTNGTGAPNGFRRGNLRRQEAIDLAVRMRDQMKRLGWAGKIRIFYRDGSELVKS